MTKVVIVDLEQKSIRGINYNNLISRDERLWYDSIKGRYLKLSPILPINPSNEGKMIREGFRGRRLVSRQDTFAKTASEYNKMKNIRNSIRRKVGNQRIMNTNNIETVEAIINFSNDNPRGLFKNVSVLDLQGVKKFNFKKDY